MIADLADKVEAGERLTVEDGRRLFQHANLAELGMLANWAPAATNCGACMPSISGSNSRMVIEGIGRR